MGRASLEGELVGVVEAAEETEEREEVEREEVVRVRVRGAGDPSERWETSGVSILGGGCCVEREEVEVGWEGATGRGVFAVMNWRICMRSSTPTGCSGFPEANAVSCSFSSSLRSSIPRRCSKEAIRRGRS